MKQLFLILYIICGSVICVNLRKYQALGQKKSAYKIIHDSLIDFDFEQIKKLNFKLPEQILDNQGSIYMDNGINMIISNIYQPQLSVNQKLCAQASYTKSLNTTGWDKLHITTKKECSILQQVWTAGYLEGVLTHQQIKNFYNNLYAVHQEDAKILTQVFDHFQKVEESIREHITNDKMKNIVDPDKYSYLTQIALLQAQLDGLLMGYNTISDQKLTMKDLYFINADGEVSELVTIFKHREENKGEQSRFKQDSLENRTITIFNETFTVNKENAFMIDLFHKYNTTDIQKIWLKKLAHSHCSALVKLLKNEDNSIKDIMVGHTTWDDFSAMVRIFKENNFEFLGKNSVMPPHLVSFSSYAGVISSTDDYYLINKQLVVMETTLEILNEDLYDNVLPVDKYIPDFMRVMISNRFATDAKSWIKWLSYINSGTYNSQWMILDLKKFESGLGLTQLPRETFMVAEQSPGMIYHQDMSQHLYDTNYWASYNIPYFQKVRQAIGFEEMMKNNKEMADVLSFQKNPRGVIFKAKQRFVKNIVDMKFLMQENDWIPHHKTDLSNPNNPIYESAAHAIAARFDLPGSGVGKNLGAIDSKVINFEMSQRNEILAISGPSHEQFPAFDWNDHKDDPHDGLPDIWNFEWILMNDNELLQKDKLIIQ